MAEEVTDEHGANVVCKWQCLSEFADPKSFALSVVSEIETPTSVRLRPWRVHQVDRRRNKQENEMMIEMNGKLEKRPLRTPIARATLAAFAVLLTGFVLPCLARPSNQPTFPSPEDASNALLVTVQKHDEQAETRILGAGSEILSSGDKVQDALDRDQFVQKYQQMHRMVRDPAGVTTLYIGAENWPFPVPLVSRNGVWRFDGDGGADEIRFRRIGENEVTAIGICHALVTAKTHPGEGSETDGLIKTVLDVQHTNKPIMFHGYDFRTLSKPGGRFTVVAYPAVYRSSGVKTFIVNDDGVVYEKDLGPKTATAATAMTTYQSGPTWAPAESMP